MYKKSILLRTSAAVGNDVRLFAGEPTSVDVYLRSTAGANANDVFLSRQRYNTADVVAAGPQSASSAAPLSATAVNTATGRKATTSAAPLVGTAANTATGLKAATSAAPVSAVASVTADGRKTTTSAAPVGAVASVNGDGHKAASEPAPLFASGQNNAAGLEGEGSSAPLSAVGSIVSVGEAAITATGRSQDFYNVIDGARRSERRRLEEWRKQEVEDLDAVVAAAEENADQASSAMAAEMETAMSAAVQVALDDEDEIMILLLAA